MKPTENPTDDLTLDLDKLNERPLRLRFDYPAARLDADQTDFTFPGRVQGEVLFTRVGQDVVAHGTLRTVAHGRCARCLEPAEIALSAAVDELWSRGADADAPDVDEREDAEPDLTHPLSGDRIELADVFRELLLAELPDRIACTPDCHGLCPHCGANLNREPCRCPEAGSDDDPPDWKRALNDLRRRL